MLLNPAIIALLGGSLLTTLFALYALGTAVPILNRWDLSSGSEEQLLLERKTYLVSTIFAYLMVFELFSLFLFLYTAQHLHVLFTGAMCAAGTLAVNGFGYPALAAKTGTFLFCGVWLIVNHTDNSSFDYALIRIKYRILIVLVLLISLGALLQGAYFLGLKADVITSCCGTLFSQDSRNIGASLAGLPPGPTRIAFYLVVALTLRVGIHVVLKGRGAVLYGVLAAMTTVVSLAAVLSFVSLYYYELPTHHCPFCLLQADYGYVGYPLYLSLFAGGIFGMGAGVVDALKGPHSLAKVVPPLRKRLVAFSMAAFVLFTILASWPMVFSDFVLGK